MYVDMMARVSAAATFMAWSEKDAHHHIRQALCSVCDNLLCQKFHNS